MGGFAAQRSLGPFAIRAADVADEMGCVVQVISVLQLLRIIRVRETETLADHTGRASFAVEPIDISETRASANTIGQCSVP